MPDGVGPPRTGDHWPTTPPQLFCLQQGCGRLFDLELLDFLRYFSGENRRCDACGADIDLWEATHSVASWPVDYLALQLGGALSTSFSLILDLNEVVTVDLVQLGLPADARVLLVRHSEGPGYRPVVLTQNTKLGGTTPASLAYELLAYPDSRCTAQTNDIRANVVWVPASHDLGPYGPLLDAARRLIADDPSHVTVLCHIAVEMAARAVLSDEAERVASQGLAREFARATSPRMAISVVAPLIAHRLNLPPLPPHLESRLDELRRARNNAAHDHSPPTHEDAVRLFTSAVFGLAYLTLITMAQQGKLTYRSSQSP